MSLEQERSTSFPQKELTRFLYSIAYPDITLERHQYLMSQAAKIPELSNAPEMYYESREQLFNRGLRQSVALRQFSEQEKLSASERRSIMGLYSDLTPGNMHYDFFRQSFNLQASDEQKAQFSKQIESMEVIGCYAQTELGHGSNVRGIETTATFDASFDGFVINSPSISSMKWWIGTLGLAANYALLIANLWIEGTNYGPHPFLIQLRDMKTHEPLPGIIVGDIGPKMGANGNDNGFLKLEFVRVPRSALLNRFARVTSAGQYEITDPNSIKILYSSLVRARTAIVGDAWSAVARAVTIAIRYSIVRRQFPDPESPGEEKPLISYQIQQYKLFTSLASAYGFVFASKSLNEMYSYMMKQLATGDDSALAPTHALVSLYKAVVSDRTVEAIEVCRRSCGGHGYSQTSGFPILLGMAIPACTYDGDNSILMLQTAKYLVKILEKNLEVEGRFRVIQTQPPSLQGFTSCKDKDYYAVCMQNIAYTIVKRLYDRYASLKQQQVPTALIWNDHLQIDGIKAAAAFFAYCFHCDFVEGVEACPSPVLIEQLNNLRVVWALNELEKWKAIIGGTKPEVLQTFREEMNFRFGKIREAALPLVEAFDLNQAHINSDIGRKDGNIYQNMIWQAKVLNPINKQKVFPAIQQLMKPKL